MVASPTTAETKSAALGLLIFDGDCGFCTSAAHFIADRSADSVVVSPWQALNLDEFGLTEADTTTASYFVQDGVAFRGSEGVAKVLQACSGPWPLLGKILDVPPFNWLSRALYPLVAKFRHKLPGATNACRIPR